MNFKRFISPPTSAYVVVDVARRGDPGSTRGRFSSSNSLSDALLCCSWFCTAILEAPSLDDTVALCWCTSCRYNADSDMSASLYSRPRRLRSFRRFGGGASEDPTRRELKSEVGGCGKCEDAIIEDSRPPAAEVSPL